MNKCTLTGNTATNYGGGAYDAILNNCSLIGNTTKNYGSGGGAILGVLNNCIIISNIAYRGGGVYGGALNNYTLSANSAGHSGGGSYQGVLNNCIVYYNSAPNGSNYSNSTVNYSCTTPDPSGVGNITNEPLFVNTTNFHLCYDSPCIDRGTNIAAIATDIEGTPRPVDGDFDNVIAFDIGAYEYNAIDQDADGDSMPDAWEYRNGLNPTNAADADIDNDHDGSINKWEWMADTDPTNPASYLQIVIISNLPPITLCFPSSARRFYTLQWRANPLAGEWTNVVTQTDIQGNGGFDSLKDTTSSTQKYYRVSVEVTP